MLIYKILLPAEWAAFDAAGTFDGSPFDRDSGFVHCSDRRQVPGTARRYFAGEPQIVVVTLDGDALADSLRWEDSYPHVYGSLPRCAVVAVHRIAGATLVDGALPPDGL